MVAITVELGHHLHLHLACITWVCTWVCTRPSHLGSHLGVRRPPAVKVLGVKVWVEQGQCPITQALQ